ncbi:MAG: protein-L-isoaspartate(D-aspartate) O-methyltransferase [Anaerolineales bacterium]
MDSFAEARARMVTEQIEQRGIREPRLLEALRFVPRHAFVTAENLDLAYADRPLPIGFRQTISQPYIVALMTDLLKLKGDERVLEVGTGCGYQAAILSKLAREVHTMELVPELAERAKENLSDYANVSVHVGDGSLGWPDAAPYDGILVAAAAPKAPKDLLAQLTDGGRLVIPVGGRNLQRLEVWTRKGEAYQTDSVISVAFVPLRGEQGWD